MTKISALPTDSLPTSTDYIPTLDSETNTTKKAQLSTLTPMYNPYKFHVYRGTAQSTGTAGFFKVNLNTEVFDTNNNFDASTNFRFDVPITGYYQFNGAVAYAGSGSGVHHIATLYKNGSEVLRGMEGAYGNAANHQSIVGGMLYLTAGDYIELYGYSLTNYSLIASSYQTYLTGFLVSRS